MRATDSRRVCPPCALLFLLLYLSIASSTECPPCACDGTTVNCTFRNLTSIPPWLPSNTSKLLLAGNIISSLTEASFSLVLDQLYELHLHGNQIVQVKSGAFSNLPRLQLLDLSDNKISYFNPNAFPKGHPLRVLNLSNTFPNLFINDSILLKDMISSLFKLSTLDLRANEITSIKGDTFRNLSLSSLDLRNNYLKTLPNETLSDFRQMPQLHLYLAGNPWQCDCNISDMANWLKNSEFVVDKLNVTCAEPPEMRYKPVIDSFDMHCKPSTDFETSYVLLGMVLALIGVIFLFVLYLNRKGIKRWIYNIRDACRDHMEGYHYRYEINSDPRLANLSLNSDV